MLLFCFLCSHADIFTLTCERNWPTVERCFMGTVVVIIYFINNTTAALDLTRLFCFPARDFQSNEWSVPVVCLCERGLEWTAVQCAWISATDYSYISATFCLCCMQFTLLLSFLWQPIYNWNWMRATIESSCGLYFAFVCTRSACFVCFVFCPTPISIV